MIGYDEGGTKTGSHNLVLGTGQSYTSYGGGRRGRQRVTESGRRSLLAEPYAAR